MANFTYQGTVGGVSPETKVFNVVAGGSGGSILQGDLVTVDNGYAALVGNGGGAAAGRYGLARTTSTETGAVNGTVEVIYCPSGILVKGKATTPGNLAAGVLFDRVSVDLSGTVQTIDENDPGAAYALTILSYDNATDGNCICQLPWLA
ncbi:MAG: hypothetical protein A4E53_01718 [Pelotomaculum sp. PtaB.Bin104]|nr:MAG: hypothetical protein A4E53_01718 [Pelotomaculum sp. PtaB.Bin104]